MAWRTNAKISLKSHRQRYEIVLGCLSLDRFFVFHLITWEEKMAMLATICAVGTAIGAVLFSLWMVKQLFTSN